MWDKYNFIFNNNHKNKPVDVNLSLSEINKCVYENRPFLQFELLLKLRSFCPSVRTRSPRGSMACADIDMDIHGAAEEPDEADHGEAPKIWCYRATEVIPEKKGPLHDLLQKQPAAFGVRTSNTLSTCSCCPPGTSVTEFTDMEILLHVQ